MKYLFFLLLSFFFFSFPSGTIAQTYNDSTFKILKSDVKNILILIGDERLNVDMYSGNDSLGRFTQFVWVDTSIANGNHCIYYYSVNSKIERMEIVFLKDLIMVDGDFDGILDGCDGPNKPIDEGNCRKTYTKMLEKLVAEHQL